MRLLGLPSRDFLTASHRLSTEAPDYVLEMETASLSPQWQDFLGTSNQEVGGCPVSGLTTSPNESGNVCCACYSDRLVVKTQGSMGVTVVQGGLEAMQQAVGGN